MSMCHSAVGTAAMIWPLIDSMNPAADVLALATVEIDLEGVELGQRITVKWRGQPVFLVRRTEQQIEQARADDQADLIDPQPDSARVIEPEWLIVVGVCTHLGCIPSVRRRAIRSAGTVAGSAPATARSTTSRAGCGVDRRRRTSSCPTTPSWTRAACGSADGRGS